MYSQYVVVTHPRWNTYDWKPLDYDWLTTAVRKVVEHVYLVSATHSCFHKREHTSQWNRLGNVAVFTAVTTELQKKAGGIAVTALAAPTLLHYWHTRSDQLLVPPACNILSTPCHHRHLVLNMCSHHKRLFIHILGIVSHVGKYMYHYTTNNSYWWIYNTRDLPSLLCEK